MRRIPGGRTATVAFATVLLSLLTAFAPEQAHATHFRYGTINWLPGSGKTVQFRVKNAWRRNADNCFSVSTNAQIPCTGAGGLPGVNDIIREDTGPTRFFFGDNTSIGSPGNHGLYYKVTSVDVTNNWLFGEALDENKLPTVDTTISHTYANNGTYTAGLDTCCRISASVSPNAHINNPDVSYRVQAIVTVGGTFAGNSSPVSNIVPIVTCFIDSICTFTVPATDPDGDTLKWRLATSIEASNSTTAFKQPGPPSATNAATINANTGLYTWDTHGATLGPSGYNTLYSTQVIVEDLTPGGTVKSHIPVDFLIQLVPKVNHPPAFSSPTCGTTITQAAGSTFSFNVTANDADAGDVVTLNGAGLPAGSVQSPALPTAGNPATSLFTWTPAGNQVGSFVISYSATDGEGQQVLCSVTLQVTCTLSLCNDNNPCTTDTCSPTGCVYTNNSNACDDGNACTAGDVCSGGTCGGSAINCNDNNGCTDDSCNPASGCIHTNNTASCNDGNACTTNDTCASGACVGGPPPTCNDNNPCTTDTCNPSSGCVFTNNTVSCNDGNACTTNDTCSGGVCVGGPAPNCNDNNPCTDDACNPSSGCTHTNNTASCSDGNACTTNDTCSGGACVGGPALVCNDNNPCTTDTCNPSSGCVFTNNTASCDDGNACTTSDVCGGGTCHGGAVLDCNDGNVCTTDGCNPSSGCTHTNNTAPCSTGNACTTNSVCSGGTCVGGTGVSCDDNNPCTTDTCDPVNGCQHTNNTLACDDGNACTTGDTCSGSACVGGAAPNCNDNNPCTDDTCNPATGCAHTNNTAPCNDGNPCTTNDTCSGGTCVGGPAVVCNDNNPCTNDSCNPSSGCVFTNNTAPCNDNNVCTTGDVCSGGVCTGSPTVNCSDGNDCTDDGCNPVTGCFHNFNTNPCDDGNACTTQDACRSGTCRGLPPPECDDGNPCTDDSCNVSTGCTHTNNTDPCDDHNVCTSGDHCAAGACVSGPPLTCADDGNTCTRDVCDPIAGCVHPLDSCDDGNICTDDSCSPTTGCAHTNNTSPCDDGDICTQGDTCRDGACFGGPTFFVEKSAKYNNGADIAENVGVNAPKGVVRISKFAFVHDGKSVTADSVVLGDNSSVWDVFVNKLKMGSGAVIRNSRGAPVIPMVPVFCPTPDNPSPCNPSNPVTVAPAATLTLTPGVYGDVSVGSSGNLILTPGNYTFCSVRTNKHVTIQVNGTGQSILEITGSLKIADDSDLFPFPIGSPAPIIYVGGPLVRLGPSGHMTARIFAPHATVRFGRTTVFDGTFCAAKTATDKQITLTCTIP